MKDSSKRIGDQGPSPPRRQMELALKEPQVGKLALTLARLVLEDVEIAVVHARNQSLERDFGKRMTRDVWVVLVAAFRLHGLEPSIGERTFYRLVAAEREYKRVRYAKARGYPI